MAKTYTNCPVEYTASIIGNKWKIIILRDLFTYKICCWNITKGSYRKFKGFRKRWDSKKKSISCCTT